ncbi:MAG TPA: hypothetical protein VLA98_02080 [Solirubrobacteraceae bacterium]|nr:hypothetical protein [Solirubrobacteraceae bacterium]HSD81939.1 hypothetical protein [Solirubrobacteraceae bacterium]
MTRPLAHVTALAVALALVLPAGAVAQQAPSLGAPETTQAAPVVTTSSSAADRGLETWQELLIFGAGIALLVGIGWAIVGDARQRAPVDDRRHHGELEAAGAGGVPPHERRRRKERARAKGRAARQARRRNR